MSVAARQQRTVGNDRGELLERGVLFRVPVREPGRAKTWKARMHASVEPDHQRVSTAHDEESARWKRAVCRHEPRLTRRLSASGAEKDESKQDRHSLHCVSLGATAPASHGIRMGDGWNRRGGRRRAAPSGWAQLLRRHDHDRVRPADRSAGYGLAREDSLAIAGLEAFL